MIDRKLQNQMAWSDPRIGDYWNEMFCPYFLIVDIQGDAYTVLCTINDPDTQNAKISHYDSWEFDYSKHSVVSKEWIQKKVKYSTMNDFVANVVRNEKMMNVVNEWRVANPDYKPIVQKSPNDIWFRGV